MFDVIIVGAGPAGLNAALVLGRCRRRVLICDTGAPRNRVSHALHGFLTRDGIAPLDLLRIGRDQLRRYDTVEIRDVAVTDAARTEGGFAVTLAGGAALACRKLLLAAGVVDLVPHVKGIDELYGRSVFHCPYCDGWEVRDQPLAVYGRGSAGVRLALELTGWSDDLVLCTDGPAYLKRADLDRLRRTGIGLRRGPIARLEGTDGVLERIVFADGSALPRRALFFATGFRQHTALPARLGCDVTARGAIRVNGHEATNVPGLYVAGDASTGVQLAIVAAAEGARAAFAINTALLREDLP
jgi:thioredoxin reductase